MTMTKKNRTAERVIMAAWSSVDSLLDGREESRTFPARGGEGRKGERGRERLA